MREPLDDRLLQRSIDGDLDAAEQAAVAARLAEDAEALRRVEAAREIGGLVRGYLARACDEVDMSALQAQILASVKSGSREVAARSAPRSALGRRRGLFWSGAAVLAACAAALLIVRLVKRPSGASVAGSTAATGSAGALAGIRAGAQAASSRASIESLDVPSSAAIFTIPDDEGEGATTVIWVSDPEPSSDDVEGGH